MNDYADIVRDWLALDPRADWEAYPDEFGDAVAALDALVAERDAARSLGTHLSEMGAKAEQGRIDAEAEVARLREAAMALYERVQMDESVGICLSERVTTLALGDALGEDA